MADRSFRTAIVTAAVLVAGLFLVPPASGGEFTVGAWTGKPYRDEKSGDFTHCETHAFYRKTEALFFSLTADKRISIVLFNNTWKLDKNDRYDVIVAVDSDVLGTFTAVARGGNYVYIALPDAELAMRALARGRLLTVQAVKQKLVYGLDGVGAVLAELRKCVSEERDAEPVVRGLFGGGGALRPWTDQETDEARVRELLDGAGLNDFGFLPPAGRRGDLAQAYYAWVKDKTIGAYFAYERPTATLDGTATGILLDYEDSCGGEFTYAAREEKFANGQAVRRTLAKCDYGDTDYRISFLFFETEKLVIAVLHMAERIAEADLQRADQAMFRFFGETESPNSRERQPRSAASAAGAENITTEAMERILQDAGLTGYKMKPGEQTEGGIDHEWHWGRVNGMQFNVPKDGEEFAEVFAALIKHFKKSCDRSTNTESRIGDFPNGTTYGRSIYECSDRNGSSFFAFIVVDHGSQAMVFLQLGLPDIADDLEKADRRIFAVLNRIFN